MMKNHRARILINPVDTDYGDFIPELGPEPPHVSPNK